MAVSYPMHIVYSMANCISVSVLLQTCSLQLEVSWLFENYTYRMLTFVVYLAAVLPDLHKVS